MKRPLASVILPVYMQGDHIASVAENYALWLDRLDLDWELLLVVNGSSDDSEAQCRLAARRHKGIRVLVSKAGGWGLAVRLGIEAAKGSILCYTNSARTPPQDLCLLLMHGVLNPACAVKASRLARGPLRKLGSWLFNLECRWLLGTKSWDVNGTPKVFARGLKPLLKLQENGDLIDAEFCALCTAKGIELLEVPLQWGARRSGSSTTGLKTARRLYGGVLRLRRSLERRG